MAAGRERRAPDSGRCRESGRWALAAHLGLGPLLLSNPEAACLLPTSSPGLCQTAGRNYISVTLAGRCTWRQRVCSTLVNEARGVTGIGNLLQGLSAGLPRPPPPGLWFQVLLKGPHLRWPCESRGSGGATSWPPTRQRMLGRGSCLWKQPSHLWLQQQRRRGRGGLGDSPLTQPGTNTSPSSLRCPGLRAQNNLGTRRRDGGAPARCPAPPAAPR